MSKAFTRESDDLPESPPIKLTSVLPFGVKNYFTPQGVNKLRQEMLVLNAQKASPASRQRIHEIEQSLQTAVVVEHPPKPWQQVSFGATVTVRNQEKAQFAYHIVGIDETNLDGNCISWLSPLAKALTRKCIGERVRFFPPDGEQVLEIVDVTFQE